MTKGEKITVLIRVAGLNELYEFPVSALIMLDQDPSNPARFTWVSSDDRYHQPHGYAWHEDEGVLWARGWGDAVEKALLAAHALVTP